MFCVIIDVHEIQIKNRKHRPHSHTIANQQHIIQF